MGFRSNASRAGRPKKFEGRRVLLVEDTRLYSVAVRSLLESRFGLVVVHCATLAAVRRELDASGDRFDVAIVDLCLADAPHGETLEYVLGRSIPAIVFSGYTSEARRETVLASGAAELVYKNSPRSLDNLVDAIERVLSLSLPTALIIDPEEGRSDVAKAIGRHIFDVVHCRTEAEALAALDGANGAIELVVVRDDLARRDGYALLDTLAQRLGEDAVRVVGFTAEPAFDAVSRFLKAGGHDFLQLPMSAADIEGRLTHTLAMHRQIQSLQRMASRDYLTDMLNRRYFFDRGPKLVEMCLRQKAPVCTALLDIDHFKRLNDTYGHEVGDLVLKAVSRKLLQLVGEKTASGGAHRRRRVRAAAHSHEYRTGLRVLRAYPHRTVEYAGCDRRRGYLRHGVDGTCQHFGVRNLRQLPQRRRPVSLPGKAFRAKQGVFGLSGAEDRRVLRRGVGRHITAPLMLGIVERCLRSARSCCGERP
ncbi:MAG: diguanylate cyclase [Rhizobium sp.]|nr:diguanylate cyclase [Rhizobium sp.]